VIAPIRQTGRSPAHVNSKFGRDRQSDGSPRHACEQHRTYDGPRDPVRRALPNRTTGITRADPMLVNVAVDLLQATPAVRALEEMPLERLELGVGGQWEVDRRFEPRMPPQQAAPLKARWREAVERSKGWTSEMRRS
jgi:hypothetical protein